MKFSSCCFLLPFLFSLSPVLRLWAADEPDPGHSVHGQSFSEGPRQFATLLGNTGNVSFPVSTKIPEAQQFFDQGVGQLHGFWYYEAERSFRQVLFLDPSCTMAYWGMAMANIENESRAAGFLKIGVGKLEGLTERERLWIKSLEKFFAEHKGDQERKTAARNLVRDWEEIVVKFPDDLEAKAFLAGLIWWNSSRRGLEISSHLAVQALLDQVFAKNPNHPAHHYVIHLWDGEKAERALAAAAASGPTAENIAHMWHMPGHIYNKTARWMDAAFQQEAAHRMDHRFMLRQSTMPDQIHNYAHNAEWLCRTFNQVGRAGDAIAVSRNMIEQPLIPRSKKVTDKPDQKWEAANSAYRMGRDRLLDTLMQWEMWGNIVDWAATPYLQPGESAEEQMKLAHALALARFAQGNLAEGLKARQSMDKIYEDVKVERQKAADAAEVASRNDKQNAEQTNKAMAEAMLPVTRRLESLRRSMAEIDCEKALAENRLDDAKKIREDLREKDVPAERRIRLDWRLGSKEAALKAAQERKKDAKGEVLPAAILTEVLANFGKDEEAAKSFAELQKLAGTADLELPIFKRLQALADKCGAKGDWRVAPVAAADTGKRSPLADYGPLTWNAGPAPQWTAIEGENSVVTPSSLAGKPYIMLFFLGKGCAHCVRQLQVFEPLAKRYAEAGIQLLAMSTDTPGGVKDTLALSKDSGGFPFPIYSDPHTVAFRAFHAFDDFESKPLHGTFLVDGQGRLRWQHISFEPFVEGEFLLKEAQRLLKL